MSGTETPGAVAPDIGYGVLGVDPALTQNVLAWGAIGDGEANDTDAIQVAFAAAGENGTVVFPPGRTYLINDDITIKSGTTIIGYGATVLLAPASEWVSPAYFGVHLAFKNENHEATDITDEDITILGLTVDALAQVNTAHGFYIRKARRVRIRDVTILGGGSSVALLGCDDTEEIGNTYKDFGNCGSDHWDACTNVRVIGCHIETTESAQMVNFNAVPTSGPQAGYVASGFVLSGCTIYSTEGSSTPVQIEPLGSATPVPEVHNVMVANNWFRGSYLVMRGEVKGATVTGNVFSDFAGAVGAIVVQPRNSGVASNVSITGNVILDPLTSVGSVGVIYCDCDSGNVSFNQIKGTGYAAAPIYTGSSTCQKFGNQFDASVSSGTTGYLERGFRLPNGTNNFVGWTDTGGGIPRMYMQTDDNWVFSGTTSSGAQRFVQSILNRSSSSELTTYVPTVFTGGNPSRWTPSTVAAAGTNIGTATQLAGNFNYVSSGTGGVALFPSLGRPQTVTNVTGATINVYPNNGGSTQIDAGGVGIPVTLADGKSKTFIYYGGTDYRTIGEF